MVCLNENQVREIKGLIEDKGSTMEELTNDLLDDICCMIEEKLESKKDYKLALQETMAVFGNSGIRTIQEETTFRKVPCLTIRDNTERPSTIEIGTNQLLPLDKEIILSKIDKIKSETRLESEIPELWDGKATQRIVKVLEKLSFISN